ncbi:Urea carboxylase-related aminomethyltransferase [hydrothermal vent metagenome]|uniref:Urea carboxylase-related aminomethyltransferase n=1 Tax=hydrothermal vent metagenome TaxID=652676 RepID=A0A3B0WQP1_9ZZZZ
MNQQTQKVGTVFYEDRLSGGCHWSMIMRKGTSLRLIDEQGGANVGMLFYNPVNLLERYNAPDTLKCQHTFKLTKGNCLYSDMGRIFCSIVEDAVGWHETVCGNITKQIIKDKWGKKTYQDARNDWSQNGYSSFLVELAKYGLGKKDMAANLNLFSGVAVDEEGNFEYMENNSKAGDVIELRFEMDTLVLLHTCPHPLSTAKEYPKKSISYQIIQAAPVTDDDDCLNYREENRRGFENNHRFLLDGNCYHD